MRHKVAVIMLVIILAVINFSIYSKEQHLKQGDTVYLKLAPVDPRSLMQGDYMALRFAASVALNDDLPRNKKDKGRQHSIEPHDGKMIVTLDSKNIATYQRIYQYQPFPMEVSHEIKFV